MVIFAAFLGGITLCVGSFLGLVSLHLPRGEDIVFGRSRCGGCGRVLKPWRMIPVVSCALARSAAKTADRPFPDAIR